MKFIECYADIYTFVLVIIPTSDYYTILAMLMKTGKCLEKNNLNLLSV